MPYRNGFGVVYDSGDYRAASTAPWSWRTGPGSSAVARTRAAAGAIAASASRTIWSSTPAFARARAHHGAP